MLSSLSSTIMTVFAIPTFPPPSVGGSLGMTEKRLVAIPYGNANARHHADLADKTATKRFTRGMRRLEPLFVSRSRPAQGSCPSLCPSLAGYAAGFRQIATPSRQREDGHQPPALTWRTAS